MIKSRTRLALGLSSFLAFANIGCGDVVEPDPVPAVPDKNENKNENEKPSTGYTAKFADLTHEEQMAAIMAAYGHGAGIAVINLLITDFDAQFGPCPERTITETGFLYSAGEGCTTEGGVTYAGSAISTNMPRLDGSESGHDPSLPMRAEFQQFQRISGDSSLFANGSFEQTPSETGYTADMNLTVAFNGPETTLVGGTVCEERADHTACTLTEGTRGELSGKGTFLARGELKTYADSYGGWLELQGQDLLRVEIVPGRQCNPITIDGVEAGELCELASDPEPQADIEITSTGFGCETLDDSGAFTVTASVRGNPDRVYVEFVLDGAYESHELVNTGLLEGTDEYQWEVTAVVGEHTSFECSDISALGVRIVAEQGDASVCQLPVQGSGSPWSGDECF